MSRSIVPLVVLLTSSFSLAQDAEPKLQVFGGYSLFHADSGGANGATLDTALDAPSGTFGLKSNFSGWNVQAQYNVNRWLGVVADFNGAYGTPLTVSSGSGVSGMPDSRRHSFMFGPVLSYKTSSKLTPFVHALFGVDRLHWDASTPTGLSSVASTSSFTDTQFAMAFGGGIDYRLSRHLSIRPGQFDYVYTGHDLNSVYGAAFAAGMFQGLAQHENNFRYSTGIVLRF